MHSTRVLFHTLMAATVYLAHGERADCIVGLTGAQQEEARAYSVEDNTSHESSVATVAKPRRASQMLMLAKDKVNELGEASAAADKTLADLEALVASLQLSVAQMSTARPTADASGSSGPLRKLRIPLNAPEKSSCSESQAEPLNPSRSMRTGSVVSVGDMSMVNKTDWLCVKNPAQSTGIIIQYMMLKLRWTLCCAGHAFAPSATSGAAQLQDPTSILCQSEGSHVAAHFPVEASPSRPTLGHDSSDPETDHGP